MIVMYGYVSKAKADKQKAKNFLLLCPYIDF